MDSKKDSRKLRAKTNGKPSFEGEKFQSPLPKRNQLESEFNGFYLRDLSPYRPIYGSSHTPNYIHLSNTDMAIIETPAQTAPRASYLEQIDEGLREISGVINWEVDDQCSEKSEDYLEDISESESQEVELTVEPKQEAGKIGGSLGITEKQDIISDIIKGSKEKKDTLARKNSQPNKKSAETKKIFCNCKKTKCLKLYCDCFRDNQTCEGCNCVGCHNLDIYEEERNNAMLSLMDRNPEAFKPKIDEEQHAKGCHCKKSNCQKKYCECFQAGLKCGVNCKCDECKNISDDHEHEPQQDIKDTIKKEKKFGEWALAV